MLVLWLSPLDPEVDGGLGARGFERVAKSLKRPARFPERTQARFRPLPWKARKKLHFVRG